MLRLAHVQNGVLLQKLEFENGMGVLKLDDTGLLLIAVIENGIIHALGAFGSSTPRVRLKVQLLCGVQGSPWTKSRPILTSRHFLKNAT